MPRLQLMPCEYVDLSGGRSHGAAAVFYGSSPLCWRAARQQLTTLSTAESELVEAVEGTLLGMSTRCRLNELEGCEVPLWIFVDKQGRYCSPDNFLRLMENKTLTPQK